MNDRLIHPVTCGISGAPGVGKTTVITSVLDKAKNRCTFAMSSDVARTLVQQGVRINTESAGEDYLAFLAVRFREMTNLRADLVMHERTIVDILAFMKLNKDAHGWLCELTEELVRWQLNELTMYLYIPIEFSAKRDGVRIVDPELNAQFDRFLVEILEQHRPDFIRVAGTPDERADIVLKALDRVGLSLS